MSPIPKDAARKQRGGTGTVVLDVLTLYVKDSRVCHTGLGRYSWYKVKGEPGHKTYFISAYAPCGNDPMGKEAAYKQQARCIKQHGLWTDLRTMFCNDLSSLVWMWRKNGDWIVLIMDTNEHVLDGELCQRLASPEYGL